MGFWRGYFLWYLYEVRVKVGVVNVFIFELVKLCDRLECEYLDVMGRFIGRFGGKFFEVYYDCFEVLMGKCLFEVVFDYVEFCLFCGQLII